MIISVFDRVENIVGKGEIACTSNFSFSHYVFKRLLSQTCQKVSLCGNGLNHCKKVKSCPTESICSGQNAFGLKIEMCVSLERRFCRKRRKYWHLITEGIQFKSRIQTTGASRH